MGKKKQNKNLFVTPAPHVSHQDSVPKIMWIVFVSLVPAGAWGVYFFGLPALYTIFAATLAALVSELLINWLRRGPVTIGDGSAAVTGILLAFTLPPYVPLYIPIAGAFFAVIVVKHLFGGLGYNVINPSLSGRVFVMFAWLGPMTAGRYFAPQAKYSFYLQDVLGKVEGITQATVEAISGATPLNLMKQLVGGTSVKLPSSYDLLFGKIGGSIGEVSAVFLLLGALWLFKRKYITWHIPLPFILTTAFLVFLTGIIKKVSIYPDYSVLKNALVFTYLHIIGGGLILGAFFMATDMVTTPLTRSGQVIMGVGAGVLTAVIRLFGGYPEGVMFAILLMELLVPLIDRMSKPKIYGWESSDEV